MKSRSDRQRNWQLPSVSRFQYYFLPVFFILIGASVGVAYGWSVALQHHVSAKRDFSFVGFIAGLLIVLLTLYDLLYYRQRVQAFLKIIAGFSTLLDVVFYNLADRENTQFSVLVFTKPNEPPTYLDARGATREVLVGILMSATMVVWQTVKYKEPNLRNEIGEIVKSQLSVKNRSSSDQFIALFNKELASPYYDQYFGVVLLDIVLERIKKMSTYCIWNSKTAPIPQEGIQMFDDAAPIALQVTRIKEQIKEFEYGHDFKPLWWVSLSIKVMGILYPFVIPPAYFTVLGADIIFVGPIMFLFVGGLVLINICIGDPFTWPTNLTMGSVYSYIQEMPLKVQQMFAARFPREAVPLVDVQMPPPPAQPGVLTTKQQQLLQQQYEEVMRAFTENQRRAASAFTQAIDNNFFELVVDDWFYGVGTNSNKQH